MPINEHVPIATTSTPGKVKPDGTTISVASDGTITSIADAPADGSVTTAKLAASAVTDAKVNDVASGKITGNIPGAWLGATSTTAAVGNDSRITGSLQKNAPTFATATKTADYSLTATDAVCIINAATHTITLPSAVSAGAGRYYIVKNGPSGTGTIVASASGTIDGQTTYTGLSTAYAAAHFLSDGTNWMVC